MKKWLVAIICIMALCLAACCALADDVSTDQPPQRPIFTAVAGTEPSLHEAGNYIYAGEYTGKYYYRLDFNDILPDHTQIYMGFGSVDSDAPEGTVDVFPLSNVYGEEYSRYTFSFPDPDVKDYADAMFVREDINDPWQKYTFYYDQSMTNGAKATITNELAPELNQEDFAVTWTAPDGGADAFYVHWEAPNGYHYPAFYAPGDATSLEIGPKNPDLVSRYCRDDDMSNLTGLTDSYGYYTIWIETLKDGCLTESDRWGCAISESAPLLMIDENGNDPEYVQKNDDGSVSVNLHQWINFKIYAPYAYQTDLYVLDNLGNLTDPDSYGYLLPEENRIATFWPDPDNTGWYDYKWYRNYAEDELTAFDQYLVAVSMYDGEPANNLISEPMTIHVSMDREIDGTITYTVPGDVNNEENSIYRVARDGFLYVDVDNEGNDADWYGLYISDTEDGAPTDYDPSWLADSHWFEKAEGKTTTRVRLSVPRCEAEQDYAVHVFGIKYGAKMAEAATTIPIHVVEKAVDPETEELCPVTLNMEDSFITGEPLRVYAHYSNPNNYKGWMNIRIYNKFFPDDVIHDNGGSFENYWDVESCGWHSGTYVVEAEIWENNQDEPTETYTLKEIAIETEDGAGEVADFELNAISSIGAGQELNVRIQTEPGEDAPEQYYVELVRLDSNGYYYDGKDAEPDENGWAEVRFDGGAFQPGSQFRVTVIGMKPGYDARRNEFRFAVTPDWTVQNLYLTVNGDDSPYQEIESSQNLRVEVGAEERPTAIRILNGDDWEYWYGDDENFTRDWGFGDGNTILYAEATWEDRNFDEIHGDEWDQLNWSSRSNVIVVHTESARGRMKAPEFTINEDGQGKEDTDLALGQHLFVNITDKYPTVAVDEGETDTPETDNWFFCDIFRVERNGSDIHLEKVDGDYDYPVQSGINCILTGNLEPGTYRIEIGADAVGYSGMSSYKEFTIGLNEDEDPMVPTDFVIEGNITITDNQGKTSAMTFVTPDNEGKLSAPTFAVLQMTAYHPGAEWYNVEITRQNDEDWHDTRDNTRGGMLRDDWRSPQTGIYTFTAYANRRDFRDGFEQNESGNWYCEIGTIVITATATNEWQDEIQASLNLENGWAHVGDQITLTFTKPENAEEYSYWIHDNDWNWLAGDNRNSLGEMTIDTNRLRGSGVYYLEADARATGYEESNKRLTFALLEEGEQPDENGFFSCSADYYEDEDKYHTGTGDEFRLMYFVDGADEVRLLDNPTLNEGKPVWNEQQVNGELCGSQGPGLTEWRSYDENEIGTHALYGMYRIDDNDVTTDDWSTPVKLCTIKVFGKLGQPNVDMMWVVDAGEDVWINFNGNENAESYDYRVILEGDPDDEAHIIASGSRTTAGSIQINSSDSDVELQANSVYRVYLDVNAEGYFSGHDERLLYVIGNDTDDGEGHNRIWLNAPETVGIGEIFELTAGADGAQDIFIRWEDSDNGGVWDRYGEDRIKESFCVDNESEGITTANGKTYFNAFARVNDNQLLVQTAEVIVNGIEGASECETPIITVYDQTMKRNGFIHASIGYDDGDVDKTNEPYEYHVNIFEKTDDEEHPKGKWRSDYCFDHGDDLLIPTSDLPVGEYLIGAWVRVNGKYSASTPDNDMATVTITKCQEQFYVSTDTVEVCEPLTVAFCAPGADRVRFSYGYGWDGNSEWEGDSWYSDNVKWEFSADEVDIVAEAMYNGEWQEIGRRHISITKKGDLDEPTIYVSYESAEDETVTVSASETGTVTVPAAKDLTITLKKVYHGEIYGINIRRISDGWNEWYDVEPDSNGVPTVVIPKEVLSEPNVAYAVTASVIGLGYNAGVSEASFVTVPATVAVHDITLEADTYEAQSNQSSVKFTVTAEGAKAVKIYHEGEASYAPTDENGVAEIELGFDQDTLHPVWASAYYGDEDLVMPVDVTEDFDWGNYWDYVYDWSGVTFEGISNIVTIRVHSNGPTQMPNWVNVPNEVAWGEWLPVEIGEGGNAEVFHIRIHETDGTEVYFMQVESNGTYDLPTTMLEPGSEYFVSICGMRPGCTWDDMEDYHFQVYVDEEGPDPKRVYITADKDNVFPYEPYHVIMHVPGAVELKGVNHEDDEDVNFILDGPDAISDDCWWNQDQLGEQTLDIYAKCPGEDDETEPAWTEEPVGSVKLYVRNRQLEKAEIRVADVVDATSDITIQIPLVENGDHYILEVHNHNTPEWMRIEKDTDKDAEEILLEGDDKEYVINYVIEADTLNVGEPYWVDCYICSNDDNYWMSDSSKSIMTADGNSQPYEDKITLSLKEEWVSDDFGRYQIPINTNFEVAINNTFGENDPKPSAIVVYMGGYIESGYYTGEGQTFTFREYQEWPETIFARAYYGDLSGYRRWEDVPLNQILKDTENWGKPTEPILVNFYSEGRAGEPDFGAPRQIFRGDDLTINIFDAGEGADETHANINCNDPDDPNENMLFGDNWVGWDEARHEIRLDTRWIGAGRYWLTVDNSGPSLSGNRRTQELEVFEYLEKPEIIVNSVVSNTGKRTIAVREVPHAQQYNLVIHSPGSDEQLYNADKGAEDVNDGWVFFGVNADLLEEGSFWIDCYADTDEEYFVGSGGSRLFMVKSDLAATNDEITISVDRYVVPINDVFRVRVSAEKTEDGKTEKAKAITVRCGDQSWGCAADENGDGELWISQYQPGVMTMYAQAYYGDAELPTENEWEFDWSSLEWEQMSDPVTMRFVSEGPAGPAGFQVNVNERGEIERGEVLVISNIYPGDGANEAHANISTTPPDEPEDMVFEDWQNWDSNTRTIYLPTSMLEAGDYWLAVDNSGIGRENRRNCFKFTVTEGPLSENEIRLTVPEKVQTGVAVPINVYAPGAVQIGFGIDLSDDDLTNLTNFEVIGEGDCAYNLTDYRWYEVEDEENGYDEHTITAIAQFSEGGEWAVETATVRICYPLSFDLSGVPGKVNARSENDEGEGISIPLPANADGMNVDVYDEWDGGRKTIYHNNEPLTDVWEYDIPAKSLATGHRITINYGAYASGFEDIYGNTVIMTTAPEGSGEHGAQVWVRNGNLDDVWANKGIEFVVSPTNEEDELAAVRFFDGNGYWEGGNAITPQTNPDWFDDDGVFFWCNYNDEPWQIEHVFAEVLLNGSDEWISTPELTFTVKNRGYVGPFDFAEDQQREITVARGDTVTFHFGEAENATEYWLDAFDENDRGYDPDRVSDGTYVTMMTARMPAGTYRVVGRAGQEEWIWTESDGYVELTIVEPDETEEPTVNLSLSKMFDDGTTNEVTVLTQEDVSWSVYAPDATSISVDAYMLNPDAEDGSGRDYFIHENNRDWNEKSFIQGSSNFGGHEGTAYIVATVTFDGLDEPVVAEITIHVTAPYGNLNPFKLRSGIYYGGSVSFAVEPDEYADWYVIDNVYLHYEGDSGTNGTIYRTPRGHNETGINGWSFDNIGEAHIGISVYQAAEGYNDCYSTIWMRPISTAATINLPNMLTTIEDEAFADNPAITQVIIPGTVTSIGNGAFRGCGNLWGIEIPSTVTSIGEGAFMTGNITIYGDGGSAAETYAENNGIDFVNVLH